MDIPLPQAIETYVRAENAGDVDAMMDCFAPFATVRDEGRFYEGLPAIKNWKARTRQKYNHTVTPLEINTSNGNSTLTAELAGNFAGSPVIARFDFALVNDRIASLRIHN
jgi:SnoaL-like domain